MDWFIGWEYSVCSQSISFWVTWLRFCLHFHIIFISEGMRWTEEVVSVQAWNLRLEMLGSSCTDIWWGKNVIEFFVLFSVVYTKYYNVVGNAYTNLHCSIVFATYFAQVDIVLQIRSVLNSCLIWFYLRMEYEKLSIIWKHRQFSSFIGFGSRIFYGKFFYTKNKILNF